MRAQREPQKKNTKKREEKKRGGGGWKTTERDDSSAGAQREDNRQRIFMVSNKSQWQTKVHKQSSEVLQVPPGLVEVASSPFPPSHLSLGTPLDIFTTCLVSAYVRLMEKKRVAPGANKP